jgi:hypothetical protein
MKNRKTALRSKLGCLRGFRLIPADYPRDGASGQLHTVTRQFWA